MVKSFFNFITTLWGYASESVESVSLSDFQSFGNNPDFEKHTDGLALAFAFVLTILFVAIRSAVFLGALFVAVLAALFWSAKFSLGKLVTRVKARFKK